MMTGASSWYLFEDGAHPAAANMAVDEVLLSSCGTLGAPILRFYSWAEPAASFGYFQRYQDVEGMTSLRPLVRRPTGGGLVPHDADWTYSFVVPPEHPWYELKAVESYKRLHEWVQMAFRERDVTVALAVTAAKLAPGQCFAGPEQFDVLWNGRKLAGAAQRRTREGLLIQGSVQPPAGEGRAGWQQAMCDAAAGCWNVVWRPLDLTAQMRRQAEALITAKYALAEYNRRR